MTNSVRSYRASAADGASQIDLLIAVYDALAEDIRAAGEAAARGDIAARCRQSERALVLLGCLESWISSLNEPALEDSLSSFYVYVRKELMRLQGVSEKGQFGELAMQVCETRAAWQQRKSQVAMRAVALEATAAGEVEQGSSASLRWSA